MAKSKVNTTVNYSANISGGITQAGQVLSANAGTIQFTNPPIHDVVTVDGDANVKIKAEGKLTIEDKDGNKYDVLEFIKVMSERMLVLHPNFEAHEQYPALKEAYEHYKFLEDLMLTGNKDAKKD